MRASFVWLCVLVVATAVHVEDDASHRAAASELLVLTGVEQTMSAMGARMTGKTPTGQEAIELQPALVQKGSEIGGQVASEHQAELEAMIQKRKQEIEASNAGSGD